MKLLLTEPHACSYLEDQVARTGFIDPDIEVNIPLYDALNDLGFRRSGNHYYRPECSNCQACQPVRIPIQQFQPKRSHQRIFARNHDLDIKVVAPAFTDESYLLYERYIRTRHADGDMFPPSQEQYRGFLINGSPQCHHVEFRLRGQLLAIAVTDQLSNGLSAVYTFFDPSQPKRSLGTLGILTQIQMCQDLQLDYLYLGYWVKNSAKMQYKINFRPIEVLRNAYWSPLEL